MKGDKSSRDEELKDYLVFQIHRNIVNIYKRHLGFIEDLRHDHNAMIKRLEGHVDPDILNSVDYLDEDKYNYLRKKTLDVGNEAIRDFERSVENLQISLKGDKEQ